MDLRLNASVNEAPTGCHPENVAETRPTCRLLFDRIPHRRARDPLNHQPSRHCFFSKNGQDT